MRNGFTTGSCAAAASKAAAWMLLTGIRKENIQILTPAGIPYDAKIVNIERKDGQVSCAVIKDGGDDPDITTGSHITATVSFISGDETCDVHIDGGAGVGKITLPGLDRPVGEAAINRVPRQMIREQVFEVMKLCDYTGSLSVVISVPNGEELAKHTYNPRLGITGGISIIGTSGIVEPMSSRALLESIRTEIRQKKALGVEILPVSPGNYGLAYMKEAYGYDLDRSVKCSNYIGDVIDMAAEEGFDRMLLTGHIGKLIKVSGGMMNTHSREGDCRMELLCAAALRCGCDGDTARRILGAAVTTEAVRILKEAGCLEAAMRDAMERIMDNLNRRGGGKIHVECMMYDNEYGLLAKSPCADDYICEVK